MNRIDSIFVDHRRKGEKAILPFLTAGDPDLATTGRLLEAVQESGASICELGFAFSDPVADGPVIESSMAHVLAQGIGFGQVFELVAQHRSKLHMGLVAMVSYSIVYRTGIKAFLRDAKQAGIDGLILPDLPLEASAFVRDTAAQQGLSCSLMIAPATPIGRARQIAKASGGFVYLLSRSGLTGESSVLPLDLPERIAALRSVTDLPIAVGFGIANSKQVRDVVAVADAAVVGSAIMRRVAACRGQGADVVVEQVGRLVGQLAQGLIQGAACSDVGEPC